MPRKSKMEENIEETKTAKEEVKIVEPTIDEKKEFLRRKKLNSKKYYSFNTRFTISFVIFLVLFVTSIVLILMSLSKINEQTVDYKESSKVDYKVLLKDNTQYDKKYFKNNSQPKIYISSLIQNIDTNFDYEFSINEKSNIEFEYNIIAKLVILNIDSTKVFYDDEIELIGNKKVKLTNEKKLNIHENIMLDFDYYNNLANSFRQKYGLNTNSYIEIILNVKGKNLDDIFDLNDKYKRSIKIPLSQQEVDIQIADDNASTVHKVITKNKLLVSNRLCISIGLISLVIAIICFVKMINMFMKVYSPKNTKYDKYIKKILKEYDRLIVNTTTAPDITNYRIVRIKCFAELLDVHDNLNLPIRYYVITEHHKSIFYVTHNNEVYVYIVKAVDLDNK